MGEPLEQAIIDGTAEMAPHDARDACHLRGVCASLPAAGNGQISVSPFSLSVIVSLVASLVLSFTLVPVLFKYLMRSYVRAGNGMGHGHGRGNPQPARRIESFRLYTSRVRPGVPSVSQALSQCGGVGG